MWSGPRAFCDGAAGLVSTADDLLAFSRMLLRRGDGLLPPDLVAAMTSDQLTPAQKAHGGLGPDFFAGVSWGFCTSVVTAGPRAGAYGWAGGFGTTWLADPARDLTVIVLTQRMFDSPAPRPCTTRCRRRRTRPPPDPAPSSWPAAVPAPRPREWLIVPAGAALNTAGMVSTPAAA